MVVAVVGFIPFYHEVFPVTVKVARKLRNHLKGNKPLVCAASAVRRPKQLK